MTREFRVNGGLVDRSKTLGFTFNGKAMKGHPGDTLASALIANGQKLVGRSFKYHRPRGVFTAGSEEPNALVELRDGAFTEPNTRATVTELFEGLSARSQNHRGSLEFDILSINDMLHPFLSAGFYYKTFMWPKTFWEKVYEPFIRSAAGLGRLSMQEDPDCYDKGFIHCDVLVIGAGPAGLVAARAAAESGARVVVADEDFLPGGRLNAETMEIDGSPGHAWAATAAAELASMQNVRFMNRTTVYGAYDHGIYGALERSRDHIGDSGGKPRQILWRIYSKRAVLAAGAMERPIAFGNNDRPGIMLAGAVRAYVNRFGAAPGKKVAVFTNNDDGWRTAADLAASGIDVAAVIDVKNSGHAADIPGARHIPNGKVVDTSGRKCLKSITLNTGEKIRVDCLAVSGGWNPNLHLTCHQRGRPQWNDELSAFVPGVELPAGMAVAGAARGKMTLASALADGNDAAVSQLESLGFSISAPDIPKAEDEPVNCTPFWHVGESSSRSWIDLQNDVTVKDVKLANSEGFRSVELLKRYTTLGMATDQGKTSNMAGLAILAEARGSSIPEVGTTIFRPPYTPVALGAFAGRSRGRHFRPYRLAPSHEWAKSNGAGFVTVGGWMRAQWYVQSGENGWRDSVDRETLATRNSVGICDVSTLGKIDIKGGDVGAFLDKVYSNTFSTLPVGKVRYGLMLREDGICYDDGTTARMGENHYVMTTTTANAVLVFRNLEFARQCLWPDMDVHLISITDGWAQFSVAGPNSRNLLKKVIDPDYGVSNESFPFMACGKVTVCGGVPARLFRISFSGELAYEIAVPSRYGNSMMAALMEAGREFDAIPYGTEALGVMRIEKGHVTGNELNGQTTALNIGLGKMAGVKKDYIGNVLSRRPVMVSEDAIRLMGFRPVDRSRELVAGSHFIAMGDPVDMKNDQGWMTSVAWSPHLGHSIGLGFIKRGHERKGEIVRAVSPIHGMEMDVEIVSAHFIDPQGERLRD
ncbi:MAG: sarcosine oxidase subunit alpha family protein [Roseovarius sp.]|nr:sarcosine oxidase subunit alpha family protein [Roseovarius sp.]